VTMRLFLLDPDTVFAARVNQSSFSYPLDEVTFDGVTTGAYGDIEAGMTVLFGTSAGDDDLGRQRIREAATSDTLYIGRSSEGERDGEVDLEDDAYITVLNDFRVWAKIPYIDDDGVIYKDSDLAVGDNTENTPPVANAGVGVAGTVSGGHLQVTLPHEANMSFATAAGGSISSYLWELPSGVSFAGGSVASDSQITVDCDPGFYWIKLTVTDSNAKTHTARVPVFARDPDDDDTISAFEVAEHRITRGGQELRLRILESISEATYPDSTLVMIWEDEPSGPTDRSHMVFCGWHHTDDAQLRSERTALLSETTLSCLDAGGKLDKLPGFTQSIENKASPEAWTEMVNPNMDLYLHYLLHWHSTVLEVADWTDSGTGTDFPFVILGSGGESLFDQVNRRAQALVPDYHLTCNRLGQLAVVIDPMLQDVGDRSGTIQAAIGEEDWQEIMWPHKRPPTIHWLRSDAIEADGSEIEPLFCIAPGDAPGQGEMVRQHSEQLAQSQDYLNACEGHRYARLNAKEGLFSIRLAGNDDRDIDPAAMQWVSLQISAATAAERGYTWDVARGLVEEMTIQYEHARTGMLKTAMIRWEREVDGPTAVTEPPPEEPDDPEPYIPPPWEKPEEDETWPEDPAMAIVFGENESKQQIGWCPDVLAAGGPSWTDVTGTLNGVIVDMKYIQTGDDSVAAWCLTTEGLYYTDNVLSGSAMVTAGWSGKLDSDDIDTQLGYDPGTVTLTGIAVRQDDPDFAIVTFTIPDDAGGQPYTCNSVYTTNRAVNGVIGDWSFSTWSGRDRPNSYTPRAVAIDESSGTIWAVRQCDVPFTNCDAWTEGAIFKSTDGGATFSEVSSEICAPVYPNNGESLVKSLLGDLYLSIRNPIPASNWIRKSSDGAAWTDLTPGAATGRGPIDCFAFDGSRVWWVDNRRYLYLTTNAGGSWTLTQDFNTVMSKDGDAVCGRIASWPGDEDKLFALSADDRLTTVGDDNALIYTDDGGSTWNSFFGDWNTVFGEASAGAYGSSFGRNNVGVLLLPRVGANE